MVAVGAEDIVAVVMVDVGAEVISVIVVDAGIGEVVI
jgi:hypothetical protein